MTDHSSRGLSDLTKLTTTVPADDRNLGTIDGTDADRAVAPVAAPAKKKPSVLREVVETLLIALIIFVAVRAVVLNFRVDGHSMDPNLHDNEMLLVNRNAYLSYDKDTWFGWIPGVDSEDGDIVYPFGKPERGDIVVLDPPESASADKPYIKRVIGEPGDTVEIRDGLVFVNGTQLVEPYLPAGIETRCEPPRQTCGPVTIPEDSVLVLGDNRINSEDSRYFGVVPIDDIIGKTWITYWPRKEIGTVPHYDYPEISN